jgi:hypothetical protein
MPLALMVDEGSKFVAAAGAVTGVPAYRRRPRRSDAVPFRAGQAVEEQAGQGLDGH